jgi:hypothetical protein
MVESSILGAYWMRRRTVRSGQGYLWTAGRGSLGLRTHKTRDLSRISQVFVPDCMDVNEGAESTRQASHVFSAFVSNLFCCEPRFG